jgi:hypothetical protein
MDIKTLLVASVASVGLSTSWFNDNSNNSVLVANPKHTGIINQDGVKKGLNLILIKRNPAKLSENDTVFQTTSYNLYTAATLKDLQDPYAFRKLLFAKMNKDGSIKVYTLSNLGYDNIQVIQNPKGGGADVFLVSRKGRMDKVTEIKLAPPLPRIYQPNEQKVNRNA